MEMEWIDEYVMGYGISVKFEELIWILNLHLFYSNLYNELCFMDET